MPTYEPIEKCPLTKACQAMGLFKDTETLEVVRFDATTHKFTTHHCMAQVTESIKPSIVYFGEWFNHETQRTRWTGPFRLVRSALLLPADPKFKQRGGNKAWELKSVHKGVLEETVPMTQEEIDMGLKAYPRRKNK